jgi:hypothetical protein
MLNRIILLLACALTIAACNPEDQKKIAQGKPHSWIDAPLNNASLPLAPVNVVSHSSDLASIAQVELSINGNILRTDANQDTTQSLVVMNQLWSPPSAGNYTLLVRAKNLAGAWGESAQVVVTIAGNITPTPTRVPIVAPNVTATPTRMPTLVPSATPTNLPNVTIRFTADDTTLDPGQCATLQWAVTGASQVQLDNVIVNATDTKRVCPQTTEIFRLRVTTLDRQIIERTLTLTINPFTRTPTRLPTVTPVPQVATRTPTLVPVVNTGPTVGAPSFSATQLMYANSPSCTPSRTARVQVAVAASDPNGVASVTMYYRVADQSQLNATSYSAIPMSLSGGNWTYLLVAPNFGSGSYITGWLQFYFVATDSLGTSTTTSTYGSSVSLIYCGKP